MWEDGLWFDLNRRAGLLRCLQEGWGIGNDELISPMQPQVAHTSPWVFAGPHPFTPNCALWNQFYFDKFQHIPKYCRTRCHKVVAKPRTVKELFQIHEIQKDLGHAGKCGLDKRSYTFGPYSAFWYCRSMDEGQRRYKEVRECLNIHLPDGEGIKMILKKGCTEMEDSRKPGGKPSTEWGEPTPKEDEMEDRLDNMFTRNNPHVTQPPWLKQKIMLDWLESAYQIGDVTYKEIIPTDIFGVNSIDYAEANNTMEEP